MTCRRSHKGFNIKYDPYAHWTQCIPIKVAVYSVNHNKVDYVNSYSSIILTTTYHIMESNTKPQACADIVKALYLYLKNPALHASDLRMLDETNAEFYGPSER